MKNKKIFSLFLSFFILGSMVLIQTNKVFGSTVITERLQGKDRFETAIAISMAGWPISENIVLATGENFPDALSAAPLAKQLNAPILLVGKTLDSAIETEINRLKVINVYIVGGEGVVSNNIKEQLEGKNLTVTRLSGNDRYETSLTIANYIFDYFSVGSEIVVATGEGFPDALSIAPVAASMAMPILLSPKTELPESVQRYIIDKNVKKAFVVGGTGVLSERVMQQLPSPERVFGADRFETNIAVLNRFASDLTFDKVYVATGSNFPDALAGSALAPITLSPIILIINIPEQISKDFVLSKISIISKVKVLGGAGVVSETAIGDLLFRSQMTDKASSENNSINQFKVVKQGDWLYYYDYKQNGVFKMMSDGSSKKRLTSGTAYFINVVGDWIYFVDEGYGNIRKAKTDGSSTSIVPVVLPVTYYKFISDLTIFNNKLYFVYNGSLYNANLDGSNCEWLYGRQDGVIGVLRQFVIRNNQMYYINITNGKEIIYRANMDGTSITQITFTPSYNINISVNWIYYNNLNDNRKIYRTSVDGELYPLQGSPFGEMLGIRDQKTEKVSDDGSLGGLNVYGDWIYYGNESDGRNLYKIKTDGSNRTKLNDHPSTYINIVDGWIYYVSNATVYKMKLDGGNDQIVQ